MIVDYEIAEAIRQGKARYCRFVDTKQWEAFVSLATASASFTFYGVDGELLHHFRSPREMVIASAPLLEGTRSSHRVSNSELAWLDEDTVEATWAMEDRIFFPPREGSPASFLAGAGHYNETWTRVGEAWRLASLELRRTLVEEGQLG